MATYTPNLNLYKPDASDDFGSFREEFNNNMDKLDNGGGGGGGGNVYGAFIDPSRIIVNSAYTSNLSYTATEDCYIYTAVALNSNTGGSCAIDGQNIASWWNGSGGTVAEAIGSYLKKGQTFTATATNASSSGYMVYGLTQGTNGIFAPVIYSDNERVIGVWRDNKPLYAKTFVQHSTDISGAGVSFDVSALDIDTCVDIFGTCDRIVTGVGTLIYPLNAYEDASLRTYLAYSKFDTHINFNIRFYVGESTSTQYITILYTKNSDVAGSGDYNTYGVPTVHYSTSEQVVGTWIDGKPIYQKSWDFSGSPVMLTYADWVNSGISAGENIKAIMSAELKYGSVILASVEVGVNVDGYPVGFQKLDNLNTRGVSYCTLRYTKTTD